MASQVLIISQADDAHLPFVQKHLTIPSVVIDPYDVIDGTELSYRLDSGKLTTTFGGKTFEDIRSVWYRKPKPIWGDELPVIENHRSYSETALLSHTRELYMHFPNAFWVSDYFAMRKAEYKALQLEVASKVGFKIPDTVFTSDSESAKAFVQSHDETIVKSLAYLFPQNARGERSMFYARKIRRNEPFNFAGLHLAPAIFQQAIDHDFDIRVTVAGNQVFAAAIRLSGMDASSPLRDWRVAYHVGEMAIAQYDLPKDIQEKCVALVKRLGLVFGAIDLISDKQGQLWFLENNPNGQWAFVEEVTGQPIGMAIAKMLAEGKI